ncbi:hypothetical protein PMAYCL1PPCAC_20833, partial [Pristionchus mayeri]
SILEGMASDSSAADGIKEEQLEVKDEPMDDFYDIKQVEPIHNANARILMNKSLCDAVSPKEIKEEPIEDVGDFKQEEPIADIFCPSTGTSRPYDKSTRTTNNDLQSKIEDRNEESIETGKGKKKLKCPECEYDARTVSTWVQHLMLKHSTTPTLAGCLLRCDCGHESYSKRHKCEISNFTLIRKGDEPIRRVTDPPVTPQCVQCKKHPKTPCGYMNHLSIHHQTTLAQSGLYLLCSCGLRYNTYGDHYKHDKKKCTGRDFTLHKLISPKSSFDYFMHLKTLLDHDFQKHDKKNQINLKCVCVSQYNHDHDYLKHDKKCPGNYFTLQKLDEE